MSPPQLTNEEPGAKSGLRLFRASERELSVVATTDLRRLQFGGGLKAALTFQPRAIVAPAIPNQVSILEEWTASTREALFVKATCWNAAHGGHLFSRQEIVIMPNVLHLMFPLLAPHQRGRGNP